MIGYVILGTHDIDRAAANAGAPGLRSGSFYAGDFRDLDGNEFNARHNG